MLECCTVSWMWPFPANDTDHRGRAGDVDFKEDAVAASGASDCSPLGKPESETVMATAVEIFGIDPTSEDEIKAFRERWNDHNASWDRMALSVPGIPAGFVAERRIPPLSREDAPDILREFCQLDLGPAESYFPQGTSGASGCASVAPVHGDTAKSAGRSSHREDRASLTAAFVQRWCKRIQANDTIQLAATDGRSIH